MKRKANIFDKIGSLISGYSGYAERDGRRICDKALRSEIVIKLKEFEKELTNNLTAHIMSDQVYEHRNFELLRKSINTLISKIEYSPYGESGFFDIECIKEEELAHIYQLDIELMESAKLLTDKTTDGDLDRTKINVRAIEQKLNKRNHFISKF